MLRIAIFTGMRSALAVTSSCAVIWKQPSPSTAHTMRSGLPTLAPIAAGTAKPMVPEPTGVDPRVRVVELPALARPHLVLAHARHDDRVVGRVVAQHVDAVLRLERAVLQLLVAERVLLLPLAQLRVPGVERRPLALVLLGAHRLHQLLDHEAAVAHDRHVGTADLAQLGGVDVDVDDLGVGRERRRPCR